MTFFRRLASMVAALSCAPLAAAPAATPFENLDLLEGRITATLGAAIGEPGGPLQPVDRRLKLAACPGSPEIAVPTPSSAIVRCPAAGWQIYVPLGLREPPGLGLPRDANLLVRRGEQVELIVSGTGFTVSASGVAQQDGAEGELVGVRANLKSAPVAGRVAGRGQVVIGSLK